jgi:hypothetical protein
LMSRVIAALGICLMTSTGISLPKLNRAAASQLGTHYWRLFYFDVPRHEFVTHHVFGLANVQ